LNANLFFEKVVDVVLHLRKRIVPCFLQALKVVFDLLKNARHFVYHSPEQLLSAARKIVTFEAVAAASGRVVPGIPATSLSLGFVE